MKQGALIRFYFGVDPDTLDEDQFVKAWCQLTFALQRTGQMDK